MAEKREKETELGNSHAPNWSGKLNLNAEKEFRFMKDSVNILCPLSIQKEIRNTQFNRKKCISS